MLTDEKIRHMQALFQQLERVCSAENKRFWTESVVVYDNLKLCPERNDDDFSVCHFVVSRGRLVEMLAHWPEHWSRIQ